MKKYLLIVECAIEYKGKFLIIERPEGTYAGGLLSFPGGKVEEQDEINHFDLLRSAVKREVLEEVGLILTDPITYVTSSYFMGDGEVPVIDSIFYCRLEKIYPDIKASKREVANYYWMDAEAIYKADNAPEWIKLYVKLIKQ